MNKTEHAKTGDIITTNEWTRLILATDRKGRLKWIKYPERFY